MAIFAIPPTLALMEEHVSMPSTPLFATVLKDIQENRAVDVLPSAKPEIQTEV